MPRTKARSVNKSEEIRKALTEQPDTGPTEIARQLTARLGVPIRAKHVSTIKTTLSRQPEAAAKPQPAAAKPQPVAAAARKTPVTVAARKSPTPRPPAARATGTEGGVAEVVTTLQGYIRRLGKADLHRLIDTL